VDTALGPKRFYYGSTIIIIKPLNSGHHLIRIVDSEFGTMHWRYTETPVSTEFIGDGSGIVSHDWGRVGCYVSLC